MVGRDHPASQLRRLLESAKSASTPEGHQAGGSYGGRMVRRRRSLGNSAHVCFGQQDESAGRRASRDGAVVSWLLGQDGRRSPGQRLVWREDKSVLPGTY